MKYIENQFTIQRHMLRHDTFRILHPSLCSIAEVLDIHGKEHVQMRDGKKKLEWNQIETDFRFFIARAGRRESRYSLFVHFVSKIENDQQLVCNENARYH